MQWRFILKEYSPKMIYIQGSKNTAVDALSRLDIADTPNPVQNNIKTVNEHYMKTFYIILIIKLLCKINRKIKIC